MYQLNAFELGEEYYKIVVFHFNPSVYFLLLYGCGATLYYNKYV